MDSWSFEGHTKLTSSISEPAQLQSAGPSDSAHMESSA